MSNAAKVFAKHAFVQALMDEIVGPVRSILLDSCEPEDVLDAIEDALDDALAKYVDHGDDPPTYEHADVVRYLKAVRDGRIELLPRDLWEEVHYGRPV